MSKSIHLTLPFPPSVNTYWRTIMVRGRQRTILSKRARAFREEVIGLILLNGRAAFTGRLSLTVSLSAPTKRKYDLDNMVKAIQDALEHGGIYENDNQIDQLVVNRLEPGRAG